MTFEPSKIGTDGGEDGIRISTHPAPSWFHQEAFDPSEQLSGASKARSIGQ